MTIATRAISALNSKKAVKNKLAAESAWKSLLGQEIKRLGSCTLGVISPQFSLSGSYHSPLLSPSMLQFPPLPCVGIHVILQLTDL